MQLVDIKYIISKILWVFRHPRRYKENRRNRKIFWEADRLTRFLKNRYEIKLKFPKRFEEKIKEVLSPLEEKNFREWEDNNGDVSISWTGCLGDILSLAEILDYPEIQEQVDVVIAGIDRVKRWEGFWLIAIFEGFLKENVTPIRDWIDVKADEYFNF